MDARDKLALSGERAAPSDEAAVRRMFERIASAGVLEGIEELLRISHDDVEMSAYAQAADPGPDGERDKLHGKEAVRAFFRGTVDRGVVLQLRPRNYSTRGDTVVVGGSMRVSRPDGSFAETRLRWNFHFRGGLVDEIGWEPSAGN